MTWESAFDPNTVVHPGAGLISDEWHAYETFLSREEATQNQEAQANDNSTRHRDRISSSTLKNN